MALTSREPIRTSHMHRTIGMSEAAGFDAIESEDRLAAYAAWQKVRAELASGFGAGRAKTDRAPVEKDMLQTLDIEKLLAIERATVERGSVEEDS